MALPQQGTETKYRSASSQQYLCVNGLTPTGDGNLYAYCVLRSSRPVLMALPQQGTETFKICFVVKFHESVNGLTPTGDGNSLKQKRFKYSTSCVNGLTPTGDGNRSKKYFKEEYTNEC